MSGLYGGGRGFVHLSNGDLHQGGLQLGVGHQLGRQQEGVGLEALKLLGGPQAAGSLRV